MIEYGLPLAVRVLVVKVATPELRVTAPSVKGVPLSSKVTVPVGVPEPGETAATVAVNVTD